MTYFSCLFERVGDFSIGLLLLGLAAMLSVIGLTVIPVIGLVVAVPVLLVAVKFLGAPLGKACSLS